MEAWKEQFRERMQGFAKLYPSKERGEPVSIKIRVESGCYSRSCCPHAYRLIDEAVAEAETGNVVFALEEHETGPEILAYVASGLNFAKAVIELVVSIIKARSEGRKKGDKHSEPVTLIYRRVTRNDEIREETVLRFNPGDEVDPVKVRKLLTAAAGKVSDAVEGRRGGGKKSRRRSKGG